MFTKSKIVVPILAAILALGIFAPSAFAGGEIYTAPGGCQFQPATFVPGATVTTGSNSSSKASSEVSIPVIKKAIRHYEVVHHVRVAVRYKENGIKGSHGCLDPVKQGIIKPGGLFWNHSLNSNGESFLDHWEAGRKICHYHEVTIGGHKYLEGTKDNCGNPHIRIPLHFKIHVKYRVKRVVEVKSYPEFWVKYVQGGKSEAESESGSTGTATTEGHYTCPAGWTLEGSTCKKCPPPQVEEVHPPTIKNVYQIQEARAGERNINFYADLFAPVGDEVVLLFEAEYGWFTPYKFEVAHYGSQSHFVTKYNAPSEPLFDPVCVTALDKTTGLEAIPQCQLVEVQPVPEPPS